MFHVRFPLSVEKLHAAWAISTLGGGEIVTHVELLLHLALGRFLAAGRNLLHVVGQFGGAHLRVSAASDELDQRVVDEDKLLLVLDQVVSLVANVHQEAEHVHCALIADLTHHGVQHDIRARTTYASAKTGKLKSLSFGDKVSLIFSRSSEISKIYSYETNSNFIRLCR